jgi:hypothetical protein
MKNRSTTPSHRIILILGGLVHAKETFAMCDYSLHGVRSRPAEIGDKLVTKDFGAAHAASLR